MSKYTTEVRFICENYSGLVESVGYNKVDEIVESARGKVFDFNYPIFDEAYRSVLETKILKHFYTREIGAETVGLWKLWLNTRLNEIMPYYNKLYKSELLEFNPLYDVDYTRTQEGTKQGTKTDTGETTGTLSEQKDTTADRTIKSNGTGTTNNNGSNSENDKKSENNYYSDTPQGGIGSLETHTYLTNARLINQDTENSSSFSSNGETSYNDSNTDEYVAIDEISKEHSGTSKLNSVLNNTEEYLEHVQGKHGGQSYSKMLEEYRTTFLNIDMQVINELNDLFMNLW